MSSRSAVIALVAVLCVAAAGGGAYLAVRENGATPAVELSALPPTEPAGPAAAAQPSAGPATATDTVVPVSDAPAEAAKTQPTKEVEPSASNGGGQPTRETPRARRTASARETPRAAPSSAPSRPVEQPPAVPAPEPVQPETAPEPDPIRETVAPVEREPEREAPPPARTIEELVVWADSVIGLQMETTLHDRARARRGSCRGARDARRHRRRSARDPRRGAHDRIGDPRREGRKSPRARAAWRALPHAGARRRDDAAGSDRHDLQGRAILPRAAAPPRSAAPRSAEPSSARSSEAPRERSSAAPQEPRAAPPP